LSGRRGIFGRRRTVPFVEQLSATECGLACLAMVLRYHGQDVAIDTLRGSGARAPSERLPPASGEFDILVEGTSVARFQPNATATGFYDAAYPIPIALTGLYSRP